MRYVKMERIEGRIKWRIYLHTVFPSGPKPRRPAVRRKSKKRHTTAPATEVVTAGTPAIESIAPAVGAQGGTLENVVIKGRHLAQATDVTFAHSAIVAEQVTAPDDSTVIVERLRIAQNVPPRQYRFKVVTPLGS